MAAHQNSNKKCANAIRFRYYYFPILRRNECNLPKLVGGRAVGDERRKSEQTTVSAENKRREKPRPSQMMG